MWKPGDRLSHRYNPELGPGLVVALTGRRLLVHFPESDEALRFAADSDALQPLVLGPGSRALHEVREEIVIIEAKLDDLTYRLTDGETASIQELWPLPAQMSPVEQLARGKIDSREDFTNRLDALHLREMREADGLGSFLGGRIRLFPHQLYVAERACGLVAEGESGQPVRWLLADEVGLGKTVEACLIMNRLLITGQATRTLVIAPDTLTVQWLSELWRKYHQIFVLVDDRRLNDVVREHGEGFNPFDVYRQAIVSSELLVANRRLVEQAVEAGIDLLVVDEAHHLKRPEGHPGNAEYRAVAAMAEVAKHLLLLTATPLEDDAHGFFRLLQILRPDVFPEGSSFEEHLASRSALPPCTSATRRQDIGGLPPRLGVSVDIDAKGWAPISQLEEMARSTPVGNALERKRKADLIERALASAASLEGLLPRNKKTGAKDLLADAKANDPRALWLTAQASRWRKQQEKTLVFVAHKETLDFLKDMVERRGRVRVGIFHEELTPERRDIEVAQFRLPDGPAMLISTECGGEGRNFEFCKRLVLFDLPWNPAVVEQRIGRLDRIGREEATEIVFFRPPSGFGRALVDLYEALGLFRAPLGGMQRELRRVADEVEQVAVESEDSLEGVFDEVLEQAQETLSRVQEAAFHELHRDQYQQSMAEQILQRVPEELDEITEQVILRAAARFGFDVERQSGRRAWMIEFGSHAVIDHLPGVPAGSRFLGTFDRQEAVDNESLEFFAAGHSLVEGILIELEEGTRGRCALLQIAGDEEVFGLLAVVADGLSWRAIAVDNRGNQRPDLAELLTGRGVDFEGFEAKKWTQQKSWRRGILRMADSLPDQGNPILLAAFHIRQKK